MYDRNIPSNIKTNLLITTLYLTFIKSTRESQLPNEKQHSDFIRNSLQTYPVFSVLFY